MTALFIEKNGGRRLVEVASHVPIYKEPVCATTRMSEAEPSEPARVLVREYRLSDETLNGMRIYCADGVDVKRYRCDAIVPDEQCDDSFDLMESVRVDCARQIERATKAVTLCPLSKVEFFEEHDETEFSVRVRASQLLAVTA